MRTIIHKSRQHCCSFSFYLLKFCLFQQTIIIDATESRKMCVNFDFNWIFVGAVIWQHQKINENLVIESINYVLWSKKVRKLLVGVIFSHKTIFKSKNVQRYRHSLLFICFSVWQNMTNTRKSCNIPTFQLKNKHFFFVYFTFLFVFIENFQIFSNWMCSVLFFFVLFFSRSLLLSLFASLASFLSRHNENKREKLMLLCHIATNWSWRLASEARRSQ